MHHLTSSSGDESAVMPEISSGNQHDPFLSQVTPALPITEPSCITISDDFTCALKHHLKEIAEDEFGAINLSDGPYLDYLDMGKYSLHAHDGSIDEHNDGAGYTYGLILIADGDHYLKVGDQRYALTPGTFFFINSDENHATECLPNADGSGRLAFVARDFYHHQTTVPYQSQAMLSKLTNCHPDLTPECFISEAFAYVAAALRDRYPDRFMNDPERPA